MRETVVRTLYLIAGILCIVLGLIGVIIPILPTTPFILVAAFCFSRSSEKLHQYLLNHRVFGTLISNWEKYGVIPLKAKILSTTMMLLMVSYPLFFKTFHLGLKATVVATICLASLYIWSRPSEPGFDSPFSFANRIPPLWRSSRIELESSRRKPDLDSKSSADI